MESIGFKEWALICEVLGRGEQSIILRKGGIAEGREGFSFQHREFFLFPTWFHEQPEKVRQTDISIPETVNDRIEIRYFVKLESSHLIISWEVAEALQPFHRWQPSVVRERFQYDHAPGLHVAFVRTFRVNPAWIIANEKRYGGCRSWVNLPEPPAGSRFEPVLTDQEHARVRDELESILSPRASA